MAKIARSGSLPSDLSCKDRRKRHLMTGVAFCLGLILACAFLPQSSRLGAARAEETANPNEAQINMLQAEVNRLQAEVNLLRRENERLRKELDLAKNLAAGAAQSQSVGALGASESPPMAQPAATQTGQLIYKDKARTGAWLALMYNKFADTIAIVDGRFVDLGEGRAYSDIDHGYIYTGGSRTPRLGEVLQPPVGVRVLQVRDATSVLMYREARAPSSSMDFGSDEVLYIVGGLDTSKIVDDSPLDCKAMVYVGPERRGTQTVCRFQIPRKLTQEEFQAALKSGFELATYLSTPSALARRAHSKRTTTGLSLRRPSSPDLPAMIAKRG